MSGERNRMRRLALLITLAVSTGGLGIFPARPACASDVYEGGDDACRGHGEQQDTCLRRTLEDRRLHAHERDYAERHLR
ncbi:MAG: hypothetical protein ACFNLM_00495 [Selenomonas noxia]